MLRIGLTGGVGSGKSTVAKLFAELHIPIIDADQIAHEITEKDTPIFKKLVRHFGPSILDKAGLLNRKKLRDIIFEKREERRWLENLLHPDIIQRMQARSQKTKAPYVILVIPLLAETKSVDLVDRVLVVDA